MLLRQSLFISLSIFLCGVLACDSGSVPKFDPALLKNLNANYQSEDNYGTRPVVSEEDLHQPQGTEDVVRESDPALLHPNLAVPPLLPVPVPGPPYGLNDFSDHNHNNSDNGQPPISTVAVCGNGILDANEQCDDKNLLNGDGCDDHCFYEGCGNGILDSGEECDDKNKVNGDGCSAACVREYCGNNIVDPKEQCDDGNTVNGDGCSQFCQLEICGNGVVTANEQCDDGNHTNGDGCNSECKLE
jgi:cysteine-rich repeat protein